jgi:hypothetical protein
MAAKSYRGWTFASAIDLAAVPTLLSAVVPDATRLDIIELTPNIGTEIQQPRQASIAMDLRALPYNQGARARSRPDDLRSDRGCAEGGSGQRMSRGRCLSIYGSMEESIDERH